MSRHRSAPRSGKSESWSARRRRTPRACGCATRRRQRGRRVVHPLGVLGVHQTVAPLDVTLEKVGEAPIAGPKLLVLSAR